MVITRLVVHIARPLPSESEWQAIRLWVQRTSEGKLYGGKSKGAHTPITFKWPNSNNALVTTLTLSLPSSKVHSPNLFKKKCVSEVVRIGSTIMFHRSKLWLKSHVLHTVWCYMAAWLQGKFDIDHCWETSTKLQMGKIVNMYTPLHT